MSAKTLTIDRRDGALLVFLSILWGGGYVLAGVALKDLPPLTIVCVRVAIGALTLLPVVWLYEDRLPRSLRGWAPFFVMGVLNNVIPFSLLILGQSQTSAGLTAIVNATTPLFTVLVTAAYGEERLTASKVIGVLLGLVGVAILRGQDADISSAQTLGIVLCLGAALSFGFSGLWGRRKLQGVAPHISSFCQLLCSAVVLLPFAALFERPWTYEMPGLHAWLSLIGLGALSTGLAYLVFFRILARSGATNAMLVTLLMPITTVVLGHFVLGEVLHAREAIGALVIASALVVIDGRLIRRLSKTAGASFEA
jgi:drug/metabolite transporter (DMT)-like permease